MKKYSPRLSMRTSSNSSPRATPRSEVASPNFTRAPIFAKERFIKSAVIGISNVTFFTFNSPGNTQKESEAAVPRYLVFWGYAPVPGFCTSAGFPSLLVMRGSNSSLSQPAKQLSTYKFGRGTCGHGCAAARGGFEPRRPEGRLLPKY